MGAPGGWIITRFCCGSKDNKAFLWCHKNARLRQLFCVFFSRLIADFWWCISFTNITVCIIDCYMSKWTFHCPKCYWTVERGVLIELPSACYTEHPRFNSSVKRKYCGKHLPSYHFCLRCLMTFQCSPLDSVHWEECIMSCCTYTCVNTS